jgi:putative ABC transport system permease protein
MISTLFKISLRNLIKHKAYSLTNVLGLTIGFAAFMLIAVFIRFDLSWDKHNANYNRLYRVQRHYAKTLYAMDGNDISPHSRAITASLLEGNFPEIDKVSVIREIGGKFLSKDVDHLVYDQYGIYADENFFDLFTYRFIEGQPAKALAEPFTVVISQSLAQKVFGTKPAIGQTILFEKKYQVKVSGVYADLPLNAAVRPSYIISFSTLATTENIKRDNLYSGDCMTYVMLKPNADAKQLESKIKNLFSGYKGVEYEELQLCPMSKVFLNFNGKNDYRVVLKLFGLIAFFILLMSVFNYINLSIAKSSLRGKEVAIKKVMGSNRKVLIVQFLSETFVMSLVSLVLAYGLTAITLPVFSNIVNKTLDFQICTTIPFMLFMFAIMLLVGLLSGIYPALFMSSKRITALLKGDMFDRGASPVNLKKLLVTFQFGIALFLILLTMSFSLQIRYMTSKNLGFNKDGILYAEMTVSQSGTSFDQLRSRILQHPEIKEASMSKGLPFVSFGGGSTNWEGGNADEKINCRFNTVSYDYLKTLGATIIAGRDFSRDYRGDIGKACIINESAAKCFGWDNPIGKHLSDNRFTVVGVVKNFIYKDMHNGIEPNIMVLAPEDTQGTWIFAFRVESDKMQEARAILTNVFETAFPSDPFEFHDLPSAFNNENSYKIYHAINRTILFFSVLNIILAIIGLLGLVSFTVARRNKEIGIRKINGSTVLQIFYLLNQEYFVLLAFALMVGIPGAWWVYESIPGANKLHVQPWVFLMGVAVLLVIIVVTTTYQTIKAATKNPVDALRYE